MSSAAVVEPALRSSDVAVCDGSVKVGRALLDSVVDEEPEIGTLSASFVVLEADVCVELPRSEAGLRVAFVGAEPEPENASRVDGAEALRSLLVEVRDLLKAETEPDVGELALLDAVCVELLDAGAAAAAFLIISRLNSPPTSPL